MPRLPVSEGQAPLRVGAGLEVEDRLDRAQIVRGIEFLTDTTSQALQARQKMITSGQLSQANALLYSGMGNLEADLQKVSDPNELINSFNQKSEGLVASISAGLSDPAAREEFERQSVRTLATSRLNVRRREFQLARDNSIAMLETERIENIERASAATTDVERDGLQAAYFSSLHERVVNGEITEREEVKLQQEYEHEVDLGQYLEDKREFGIEFARQSLEEGLYEGIKPLEEKRLLLAADQEVVMERRARVVEANQREVRAEKIAKKKAVEAFNDVLDRTQPNVANPITLEEVQGLRKELGAKYEAALDLLDEPGEGDVFMEDAIDVLARQPETTPEEFAKVLELGIQNGVSASTARTLRDQFDENPNSMSPFAIGRQELIESVGALLGGRRGRMGQFEFGDNRVAGAKLVLAKRTFDDWKRQNPNASLDEVRTTVDNISNTFNKEVTLTAPVVPSYPAFTRNTTEAEVLGVRQDLKRRMENGELTPEQIVEYDNATSLWSSLVAQREFLKSRGVKSE